MSWRNCFFLLLAGVESASLALLCLLNFGTDNQRRIPAFAPEGGL